MRNTIYVEDRAPMFAGVAAIAQPGTLIVVEDEEAASAMRRLVTVFGQTCLTAFVEASPEINAITAKSGSVEVRTVKEIEQMDANEKQAMEVW